MSEVQHTWRLYAPDEGFEIAVQVSNIVAETEPEELDHWFENGWSVFGGRGTPPRDPRIERRLCEVCIVEYVVVHVGCDTCCDTGYTYHWLQTPPSLIQESIDGLHQIIHELDDPLGTHELA